MKYSSNIASSARFLDLYLPLVKWLALLSPLQKVVGVHLVDEADRTTDALQRQTCDIASHVTRPPTFRKCSRRRETLQEVAMRRGAESDACTEPTQSHLLLLSIFELGSETSQATFAESMVQDI
jgi:hypothetical protein